jgi:hypothetical protein
MHYRPAVRHVPPEGSAPVSTIIFPLACFEIPASSANQGKTHGFTKVVMATAALLGYELAPRIKDIKDQTLYKIDRQQHYANLDPILVGTIKPHLIRNSWDETVRVIASIEERIVSPSLVLHRLGSYAIFKASEGALTTKQIFPHIYLQSA